MGGQFYKEMLLLCLFFSIVFLNISCGKKAEKEEEFPFEICKETELPDELSRLIEKKKEEPFRFTYENSAHLYLAIGYGIQPEGEYAVMIKNLMETEQTIQVDSVLIRLNQMKGQNTGEPSSYPYVVLRCEKIDKRVVFL